MKKISPPKNETPSGQGKGLQSEHQNGRPNSNGPARFLGTDNPRHLRAIQALLTRPTTREQIDQIAGCANGPALISSIRDLFSDGRGKDKHLTCERIHFIDRDGKPCRPGVYALGAHARRMIYQWLALIGGHRAKRLHT
jgi:hypothetical protein